MTDFLLELRSEEIPARMQARAREDLVRLFAAELSKAGLTAAETVTYATPRRLALIARGLPDATAAVSEELKGPRTSAPPQALEGFLRKTGLTRDRLTERDGVYFAVSEKPGRATAAVLADAIPAVIRAFPWPKSMRWGDASLATDSLRWVRPLHGIVAIFGEELVPVEIAGVPSGYATLGHRFHHPGPITLGGAHDYVEKLRACHVLVDPAERETLIRDRAGALAAEAGLALVEDEGLVVENAGLTEWPVPLLGRFDEAFLDVPPEVIQLTARVNQKYFVCQSGDGKLANAFICTANIDAADGGARIVEGNRKVLAARLSDARFFYEQDLKVPLEEQAKKLDRIIFHEKLGTVADKVDRVAKLARWLVEEGIVGARDGANTSPSRLREGSGEGLSASTSAGDMPSQHRVKQPPAVSARPGDERPDAPSREREGSSGDPSREREGSEALATLAERAARLCKADLVTGMVGEFPELQGIMGGYYAAAQGEDPRVAAAIRDHYKPVGQGDEVPTAPVTVAVSLADKLDTLIEFFSIEQGPTGSRDPFALRRAALGVSQIITSVGARVPLTKLVDAAIVNRRWSALGRVLMHDVSSFSLHGGFDSAEYSQDGSEVTLFLDGEKIVTFKVNQGPTALALREIEARINPVEALLTFFADRLKVQQREAGVRHDLIDAVFALGGEDDLVRLLARVRALQAFVGTQDGANLLTGYRRAANILKKENYPSPLAGEGGSGASATRKGEGSAAQQPSDAQAPPPSSVSADALPPSPARGEGQKPLSYTPEPEEYALHAALDTAEPAAADAVAREDFGAAMAALASLRAPIDRFFDAVTVNDPDPAKRAARLALLARVRDAVHTVADFSTIEG